MQIIRLVEPGVPDRVIGIDELPAGMLTGVETTMLDGFPRHWKQFNPVHHVLFFKTLNKDKEKWQEITNYLRRACSSNIRLMDKIENMAISLAPDSKAQLAIEPEDIPIVPVPKDIQGEADAVRTSNPASAVQETTMEEAITEAVAHTCKNRGRGKLSEPGTCARCDDLRNKKEKATAVAA